MRPEGDDALVDGLPWWFGGKANCKPTPKALSWTPTTITTYFNGVPWMTDDYGYGSYVASPDTAPEPFNQPFFLAFTSAFGMTGSDSFEPGTTVLPATMKIDWVRSGDTDHAVDALVIAAGTP